MEPPFDNQFEAFLRALECCAWQMQLQVDNNPCKSGVSESGISSQADVFQLKRRFGRLPEILP
jgi:hypothetical protein